MLARLTALTIDLLLLLSLVAVAITLWSGGTVLTLFGIRIGLRSVDNPLIWTSVLALGRVALLPDLGFLLMLRPGGLGTWLDSRFALATVALKTPCRGAVVRFLVVLVLLCTTIKLCFAWIDTGFYSGDDVEIHEMTLSALLGRDWPIWGLRSPFFPMTFVFPGQFLAHSLGVSETQTLVFSGRAVVAVLSSFSLLAMFVALRGAPASVAMTAIAFFASSKLSMAFGSSELPRPISTLLVLSAYAVLVRLRRGALSAALVGVLLALASLMRFSEVVFVVPAVLSMLLRRTLRDAVITALSFVVVFSWVAGLADWLYWGSPFFSLRNIVDYTLVQGRSSRGYQPFWYYLAFFRDWTNWIVLLFVGFAVVRRREDIATLWFVMPLGLLSLLPHKEPRYLIPLIPFVAILGAYGAAAVAGLIRRSGSGNSFVVPLAILVSVVLEVPKWRLDRDNQALNIVTAINSADGGGLAAEQLWRLGGRLYVAQNLRLLDLDVVKNEGEVSSARLADCDLLALRRRTLEAVQLGAVLGRDWVEVALPDSDESGYRLFRRRPRHP